VSSSHISLYSFSNTDFSNRKLQDFSGTDPLELLRAAGAVDEDKNQAIGRFALQARRGAATDAVSDLYSASNASLLDQIKDAETEGSARPFLHGAAVAAKGDAILFDHRPLSNRKRSRDEELGEEGDQPKRSCVRWDWKGQTDVAGTPTAFKCRVVLQGSDVFAGMRAMMDAGLMRAPLPVFVKDAASLGEGGTIVVDHGAVRTRVDKKKYN
jgi:hypothetical protein